MLRIHLKEITALRLMSALSTAAHSVLGGVHFLVPGGSLTVCDYHIKSQRSFFPVQIKTEQQTKMVQLRELKRRAFWVAPLLEISIYLAVSHLSRGMRDPHCVTKDLLW